MADIELVIKIPEDVYKKIVADKYAIYDKMFYSIKNGTPLNEREPKTGHWYYDEEREATGIYAICSNCDEKIYQTGDFKYCPNCGAKMVKPQESEDKE